jgi:L,D-transpeptidase catalytic domain/Putative peptidoglycan binding domain
VYRVKKRRWVAVVVAVLAVLVVGGGAAAYAIDRAHSDTLARGTRVAGIDVGDLSVGEAQALLHRRIVRRLGRPLVVVDGQRRYTLTPAQAGLRVDVAEMVDTALDRSRRGNFVSRVYREATGARVETRVRLRVRYSDAAVRAFVARIARSVDRPAVSAKVVVPSAAKLVAVHSRNGIAVYRRGLVRVLEDRLVHPSRRRVIALATRVVHPEVSTAELAKDYPAFITIDRAAFTLRLFRNLRFYKAYRIAVGRQGLETPGGQYEINDKQVNPSWHVPNSPWAGALAGRIIPPGPDDPIKARWLGFYNGAGIHGTDDIGSLGSAASHGCIRMSIPDVEQLYGLVPLHTPIYIA